MSVLAKFPRPDDHFPSPAPFRHSPPLPSKKTQLPLAEQLHPQRQSPRPSSACSSPGSGERPGPSHTSCLPNYACCVSNLTCYLHKHACAVLAVGAWCRCLAIIPFLPSCCLASLLPQGGCCPCTMGASAAAARAPGATRWGSPSLPALACLCILGALLAPTLSPGLSAGLEPTLSPTLPGNWAGAASILATPFAAVLLGPALAPCVTHDRPKGGLTSLAATVFALGSAPLAQARARVSRELQTTSECSSLPLVC